MCPSLPIFLVRPPHVQGHRSRPQWSDHLKQGPVTHNVQTFYGSCCVSPMRQTQDVQTDAFSEVQHLSRNCGSRKYGLHVFSTNITMHSSCLLGCQLRSTTVFQHTYHCFNSWVSQFGMELSQCSLHSFNILSGMDFSLWHRSVALLTIFHVCSNIMFCSETRPILRPRSEC